MKLIDFLNIHGSKMGYLERKFLETIYFKDLGEAGLDFIQPEVEIERDDGSAKKWRIDFVITTKRANYAIECDGFNYHAQGQISKQEFNEQTSRRNGIIGLGYKLLTYTRDQIENDPQNVIYELRRKFFNSDEQLFNIYMKRGNTVEPNPVQESALNSLRITRNQGNKKGLVVMASGLGKTILSIFDVIALKAKTVLYVVHQEEILNQAYNSFSEVMPNQSDQMGFFTGEKKSYVDKNIIFSTIQTISKKEHMEKFDEDFFDYIIIDESHHTAAPSYRKITEYFTPTFLLGITATPERMDKKDVLAFYGDNEVYKMEIEEAIEKGFLANLHYKGLYDNIDYSNIYHNGFKYSVQDLNKLLMVEKRDQAIIQKYKELAPGKQAIAFCSSIEHADWTTTQFNKNGIKAVAIHSKLSSKRTNVIEANGPEIIDAFKKGNHQVAVVVDMFNEGVDIPDVECLLLLRPTESKTIFTQQIGRGLRIAHGKEEVLVLDFIGNYKTSPQILAGLGITPNEFKPKIDKDIYHYDNNGMKVEFSAEVIDIFRFFISKSSTNVDKTLISDKWQQYQQFLGENKTSGLFWSVGKKNNDLKLHVELINFWKNQLAEYLSNKDIDNTIKQKAAFLSQTKGTQTFEGIRGFFLSKLIGLIQDTNPLVLSPALDSILQIEPANEKLFSAKITGQIEKLYFYNDIYSLTDKNRKEPRSIDKEFFIYPMFFLYQVIIRLFNSGHEPHVTKNELSNFVSLARNHFQLDEITNFIIRFREDKNKYEIEKYLNYKKPDTRFHQLAFYSKYLIATRSAITANHDNLGELSERVTNFEKLINSDKLIKFTKANPQPYRKLLYSDKDLFEYHFKYANS